MFLFLIWHSYLITDEFYRSEFEGCKVYSTEREINTEGVTRAGKNMVRVHIISIFKGTIGTGRQILHTEIINTAILGRLLGPVLMFHYHITTQSLALTGMLSRHKIVAKLWWTAEKIFLLEISKNCMTALGIRMRSWCYVSASVTLFDPWVHFPLLRMCVCVERGSKG